MYSSAPKSTYTLNSGYQCPILGLGTSEMKDVSQVIYASIKDGTRLIDTAAMYENEEEIGKGINQAITDGIVKREDLFIITKLNICDRENPEEAIKLSLKKLNLSYVDLYLDHWPMFIHIKEGQIIKKAPMHVVWEKMESFVEKGYTKSIGVSNYNVQSLCNLLSFCKIKPAFLEVEFHPYLYQKHLLDFCNRENIKILAYNPLVKGPYCQKFHKNANPNLLEEPLIKELASKYNKTVGQIILNWFVCLGVIPIPRTSSMTRMKENLIAGTFTMDEADCNKVCALNKNYRFCPSTNWPTWFCDIDFHA